MDVLARTGWTQEYLERRIAVGRTLLTETDEREWGAIIETHLHVLESWKQRLVVNAPERFGA